MGLADSLPDQGLETSFDPNAGPPVDPGAGLGAAMSSEAPLQAAASYDPQASSYQPPPGPMSVQPPEQFADHPGITSGVAPGAAPPTLDPNKLLALAGQGQPGARPAGFAPSTRSNTGTVFSPDTVDWRGKQIAATQDEGAAQLDAESQDGASGARVGELTAAHDEADRLELQNLRIRQQSDMARYHQNVTDAMQHAEETGKINPEAYLDAKEGRRPMAMIAAFLGGVGGALTHTGNAALEYINKSISDSIDAQKATHADAEHAVGNAQNLYQMNLAKFGDETLATQASQLQAKQAFTSYLQSQAGAANAPAQYRLRAAQLAHKSAKEVADILGDMDEKQVKQTVSETYHAASSGSVDPLARLERANKIREGTLELTGQSQGQRKTEAEIAKTDAEAQKASKPPEVKKATDSYDNALEGLYEVRRMVARGGELSPSESARGESLKSTIINKLAGAETGGTRPPSKEEQELIAKQLPENANAFQWTGADLARVDATIRSAENARARAAGLPLPHKTLNPEDDQPAGVARDTVE